MWLLFPWGKGPSFSKFQNCYGTPLFRRIKSSDSSVLIKSAQGPPSYHLGLRSHQTQAPESKAVLKWILRFHFSSGGTQCRVKQRLWEMQGEGRGGPCVAPASTEARCSWTCPDLSHVCISRHEGILGNVAMKLLWGWTTGSGFLSIFTDHWRNPEHICSPLHAHVLSPSFILPMFCVPHDRTSHILPGTRL